MEEVLLSKKVMKMQQNIKWMHIVRYELYPFLLPEATWGFIFSVNSYSILKISVLINWEKKLIKTINYCKITLSSTTHNNDLNPIQVGGDVFFTSPPNICFKIGLMGSGGPNVDYIFMAMIVSMMVQHRGDGGGAQCPPPHPGDSHHEALGEESLPPHSAGNALHEETRLWQRQTQVISKFAYNFASLFESTAHIFIIFQNFVCLWAHMSTSRPGQAFCKSLQIIHRMQVHLT